MVDFRPRLATQDAMLQLTHDILASLIPAHTKAVLALDLTKAFDRVEHRAIMATLSPSMWAFRRKAEDDKDDSSKMDSQGSGLASQRHRKTQNSSKSQDSSERPHQKSKELTTPPDAAEVGASRSAPAKAAVPSCNLDFSNPDTTSEPDVNGSKGRRHEVIPSNQHGSSQTPDQQGRTTGTPQENTHNQLAWKKDIPEMGSATRKPAEESDNKNVTEKISNIGASRDINKAIGKGSLVKRLRNVTEDHGSTDMRSAEESHPSTGPPIQRQKPGSIADFRAPAGQITGSDTTAAVLVPLGQEKASKNSRPSETESKGGGTPKDRDSSWRSNPLLALIHRASPVHKPSVSTASGAVGGTESVKLLANATGISDRPNNVNGPMQEGQVTGTSAMLLQGVGRNATNRGHALPRLNMPKRAIIVTPPYEATSEKQNE
ncbi:hypothetical protein HPB52_022327 [Rhipicephalus sanguineus]|uniref:Reverse transcriptase domain-containing protein n=1 Tax=Rhipicephalus sanguineus TaxID=34632 RepID=A0A9D4T0S5_RHISA|nr:hypothetical protein HPB52_022327 [Rhipicephalus sanguineus]